ncbi:PRC-barrel domain-containing protein [Caballeronia arvi]|uniref:PRC-barrel domain-containing protein n=1 Tax=Caballeronia arvi TaxID=1777135 RepID=A0A158KZZ7_9BURK|nr:PRC-barrel domain-containing protein [Caballeronia arvi]
MTTTNLTGSGAAQGGANIVGSSVGDGPGADVMAASTLDSTTVITSDGEDIDKIKDIMLDMRSGRVIAGRPDGGVAGRGQTTLSQRRRQPGGGGERAAAELIAQVRY